MPNQNLADLVTLTQDESHLVLKVAKTTVPAKPRALRDTKRTLKDGTAIYEVPKSDIFAYFARDLADGSVITLMRRREIPHVQRQALYDAGVAAGLHVAELEAPKEKAKSAALTLDELTKAREIRASEPARKSSKAPSL